LRDTLDIHGHSLLSKHCARRIFRLFGKAAQTVHAFDYAWSFSDNHIHRFQFSPVRPLLHAGNRQFHSGFQSSPFLILQDGASGSQGGVRLYARCTRIKSLLFTLLSWRGFVLKSAEYERERDLTISSRSTRPSDRFPFELPLISTPFAVVTILRIARDRPSFFYSRLLPPRSHLCSQAEWYPP